jgi:TonB-linked SusC/RagA family outer membrane protein
MHLKSILKFRSTAEPYRAKRPGSPFAKTSLLKQSVILLLAASSLQVKAGENTGVLNRVPGSAVSAPDFSAFTVKGKVVDKATGKPIAGATINVKGETNGTSSDNNGAFSLNIKTAKATLVISSVGYQPTEIAVDDKTSDVIIELTNTQKDMGEVIVTALGIQRSVKSLTYSAQKVTGDQVNEIRDANFTNTLSGKVAGLTVTSSASGPGSATRVLLRGNRSIQGSNNALFVVDGVAIDNSTPVKQVTDDAGSTNGGRSGSDGVSNINPDDIESISVLKGAAGSVLYGSRAANGVIIITTKKGKSGKVSVNINSGVTMDKAMLLPDFQNEYSQGSNGTFSNNTGYSWGAKISGQSVTDWTGNSVKLAAYPDNFKNFFRTGISTNNSVSMSAGTDKIQSYLSYTNAIANGIVDHNNLKRHTFNARLGWNITSRLSADAKVTYVLQNIYDRPGVGGDGMVAANIYRIPRSVNLEDIKNYKIVSVSGVERPTFWTSSDPVYMNPYWTINNTHRDEARSRVTGLLSLKYKLTDWLNIQGRVSNDSYNDFITQKYANNTVNYARNPGGYYAEGTDYVGERNIDVLLKVIINSLNH